MGQYYEGVILDRETRQPRMAESYGKLCEIDRCEDFIYVLSKDGSQYMQRVVFVGDYSSIIIKDGENLYNIISDMFDEDKIKVPIREHIGAVSDYKDWREWHNAYVKFCYKVRGMVRYLCNHDKKEYLDLNAYQAAWSPLPLLTLDPTCRIKGGGDYFYRESFEDVSRWSGDVLSSEWNIPEGYKEIKPRFDGKTKIVTYGTVFNYIAGNGGNDRMYSHTPSYPFSEFERYYLSGKKSLQNAMNTPEQVRMDFRLWCMSLTPEVVFKAFDKAKGILRRDPQLQGKHKGVLFDAENCVMKIGDVAIDLYKEDGKYIVNTSSWAELDDITYVCDRKNRKITRRLYNLYAA